MCGGVHFLVLLVFSCLSIVWASTCVGVCKFEWAFVYINECIPVCICVCICTYMSVFLCACIPSFVYFRVVMDVLHLSVSICLCPRFVASKSSAMTIFRCPVTQTPWCLSMFPAARRAPSCRRACQTTWSVPHSVLFNGFLLWPLSLLLKLDLCGQCLDYWMCGQCLLWWMCGQCLWWWMCGQCLYCWMCGQCL